MDNNEIAQIRRTLDAIEKLTREADANSKMEVLSLLGKTSQSVIATTKKLIEPKTKTRTKVVTQYKDKPQQPQQQNNQTKTAEPPTTATDKPAIPFQALQAQPPIGPLSMQRNGDNES
jgi:hypothetical protein